MGSEQQGQQQPEYKEALTKQLAEDLEPDFGRGIGWRNLTQMRAFFLAWPASKFFADVVCKICPSS